MTSYGDWLKIQLRKKGWSQTDLARAIGCSGSAVSCWCAGKTAPTAKILFKIEEVLGSDRVFLTIEEAAYRMNVSQDFIKEGLKEKTLPFGWEVNGEYYISPKLFNEFIGD